MTEMEMSPLPQFPATLMHNNAYFTLTKIQRGNKTAVYRGRDTFLRIGDTEEIQLGITNHRRMTTYAFPVPEILEEGLLGNQAYYVETSMGDVMLGKLFTEETLNHGSIHEKSFEKFLSVTEKFTQAQIKTQSTERDSDGFATGIRLDVLCQELPDYAERIIRRFAEMCHRTALLPFVLSHGDFNPHNLSEEGIIDLETSYWAPFGHDLIGGIVSIEYFPTSPQYELFAKYSFSAEQKKQYLQQLDTLCTSNGLPPLSVYQSDFEFTRAVWLLVIMHKWPKLQKFRYDKFIKKFLS